MSVLTGGIFSKVSGKTAGIVFGAARTRQGKKVTARELVSPSNPNTAAQQTQRGKFASALLIPRTLGPDIYQSDFNRAVGQLPGFQSMTSIMLNQMDAAKDLSLTIPVNLGSLHAPDTISAAAGIANQIDVSLSSELGSNGTAADVPVALAMATTDANRALNGGIVSAELDTRSDEGGTIPGLLAGVEYQIYVYMKGAGTADGLLSLAKITTATSGS